jgi:outer membrane protein assembly factor BamA
VPDVADAQETIAEIRVHGNHTTPDADIIGLSGLKTGEAASDARLAEATQALRTSGRFAAVDVRKRFRSIDDPADILVMIVIDERAGVSARDLTPGFGTRIRSAMLWMPILNYAEGYGLTYGLRATLADVAGPESQLSFPLSWGGERRAGVELERSFGGNQRSRAGVAFWVNRRVNPFFDRSDLRQQVRLEADQAIVNWLRVGAGARLAHVEFGDEYSARHTAIGPHVTIDNRIDPLFPRNAVHARAAWERIGFESGHAGRFITDTRGYLGVGRSVIALRGQLTRSDAALPGAEQSLLGGSDTLRGYRAGHRAGDNLAAVSAELRVPISSPVSAGRFGVKGFIDAGTTWDAGTRLADQRFERGVGGGLYFGAAVMMLDLDVAWPEEGRPRVHVGLGISF